MADEPGGVGVLHQSGSRGNRAGHPDADGAALARFLLGRADETRERLQRTVVAAPRRLDAAAEAFRSVGAETDRLDLGSAEIDTDAKAHDEVLSPISKGSTSAAGVSE